MKSETLYKFVILVLFAVPILIIGTKMTQQQTSLENILPKEVFQVAYEFDVSNLTDDAFVKTYLPLNTPRQQISNFQHTGDSTSFESIKNSAGQLGKWQVKNQPDALFSYQFEVSGKSVSFTLPRASAFETSFPKEIQPYLGPSENIQSDHPSIDTLAKSLKGNNLAQTLTANFHFTAQITNSATGVLTDALTTLRRNRASCNGKSRLFVALCRAQGIPARVVGGIILENNKKRTSHLWTEVYYQQHWIPFDILNNHFAFLPANYLDLYTGDHFLITHSKGINFDYQFIIQKKYQTAENMASFGPNLWLLVSNKDLPFGLLKALLLLPLAALIITIFRNVIGLKTFGIFLPILIGLSLSNIDIWTGLITYGIVVLFVSFAHFFLERWGLLHVPKVAIMLTFVILILIVLGYLGQLFEWEVLLNSLFFPVVVLTITAERFAKTLVEEPLSEALKILGMTFLIAFLSIPVFRSNLLIGCLLTYPEIYLLLLGVLLVLGRWIGMRLLEYRRFAAFAN